MKLITTSEGLLVQNDNFSAAQTFLCGQCFRFDRDGDGFTGVALDRVLRVKDTADGVLFYGMREDEFTEIWANYFDLGRDYGEVIQSFPASDAHLRLAATECGGIRILRQDPWEALISFIISQNNNIPRIKGVIDRLCRLFGDEICEGYYSFPDAHRLAEAELSDLEPLRCGYRAPYIIGTARAVADGSLVLGDISRMPYAEAKKALLGVKGVGPKVADCALLFGFGFTEAFPVDTWVKKVMRERYGENFDITSFGKYAGIAQQYLFYYERGTRE